MIIIDSSIKDKIEKNSFNYIKVEGHANYAEKGKDIVCSAVSALISTLIIQVDSKLDLKKHIKQNTVDNSIVVCWSDKDTTIVAKAVIKGLKEIEKQYGEHIFIARG